MRKLEVGSWVPASRTNPLDKFDLSAVSRSLERSMVGAVG